MKTEHFPLIVIGCGAAGAACTYYASLKGIRTLCLEQFDLKNNQGSTHGRSRIFRSIYAEGHQYHPMLMQAYKEWKQLERQYVKPVFIENGCILIGNSSSQWIEKLKKSAKHHPYTLHKLNYDQLKNTYPEFDISHDMTGLFQKEAGTLLVENCLDAYISLARSYGASILPNTKVNDITEKNNQMIINTNEQRFSSDHVIVTTGAWTPHLLTEFKHQIKNIAKIQLELKVPAHFYAIEDNKPCFSFDLDNFIYGTASIDGWLKLGCHSDGTTLTHPEHLQSSDMQPELARIEAFIDQFINIKAQHSTTEHNEYNISRCIYSTATDNEFIVKKIHDRLSVLAGLSGHGFKLSNVLAKKTIESLSHHNWF